MPKDDDERTSFAGAQLTTDPESTVMQLRPERRAGELVIVHAADATQVGRRAALGDDLFLLGREVSGMGFCLEDRRMSRIHARIAFDRRAGMFRIGDAASKNHTFVNGQQVETVLLSDGDVIRAGESLFVYCEGSAIERTRRRAEQLARSDLGVLLLGETGTGKEVIARAIHEASGRTGAFVAINCASIPAELVASELFGHTKNAFSGASVARKGMFLSAEHGTLLLDEVGDCPPEVQAALLRAIQEKAVRPVGAEREVPVDVRIIAATHMNLEDAMARGTFRSDLYARLSQSVVQLPRLRERRGELLTLITELARESGRTLRLSCDAAEALLLWHWPLNVRELQSWVKNFLALHDEQECDLRLLAAHAPKIAAPLVGRKQQQTAEPGSRVSDSSPPPEAPAERTRLRGLLETHAGNVSAVAVALGKPRAQVYRWMKSMGLTAQKYRR
jgi:DNA-binding NtrC family response regulator